MKDLRLKGEEVKYVYHFNEHTDNYNFRWMWDKFYPFKNKKFYLFKAVRTAREYVAKCNKQDKKQYLE